MRIRYNVSGEDELRSLSMQCRQAVAAVKNEAVERMMRQEGMELVRVMRLEVKAQARKQSGNLEKSLGLAFRHGIEGVEMQVGWRAVWVTRVRKRRPTRRVSTATYGPILEFSRNRQLRHFYTVLDEPMNLRMEVANAIARRAQEMIDRAMR